MGVDRILKLTSNPKPEEILTILKNNKKCSNCLLEKSELNDNFYSLYFKYTNIENKSENRKLSIYAKSKDNEDSETYELLKDTTYTYASLGAGGFSMEIMTYIVEVFGGIFIEDDMDYNIKKVEKKKIKKEVIKNIEMERKVKSLQNDFGFSL